MWTSNIKQNVCTLENYLVLLFTLTMLKGDHVAIPYSHLFEKWSHCVLNFCRNLRNCACAARSSLALNWISWFKINAEKCYCSAVLLCFKDCFFLAPFYIAFLSLSPTCVLEIIFSVPFPVPKYFCPAVSSLQSALKFELTFSVSAAFSQIWLQVQTCIPSSWWQHQCVKFLGCSYLIFSTSEPPCQFLLCECLHNLILNQIQEAILLVKFKRCSFSSWVSSLIWFIAQPVMSVGITGARKRKTLSHKVWYY